MVDNTGKINFKLTQDMSKSQCKTSQEQELFSVFDFNQNDKIDDNELQIFQKNFGKKGIKESKLEEYLKDLQQGEFDNIPLIQYLMKLVTDENTLLNTDYQELRSILTDENIKSKLGSNFTSTHNSITVEHLDDLNSSFKISLDPNQIIISQEKNGKEFLAVRVNKDGLEKHEQYKCKMDKDSHKIPINIKTWYPDGNLRIESGKNNHKIYSSNDDIVDYLTLMHKNYLTTAIPFDKKVLEAINKYNIGDVFEEYQKQTKSSLYSDIIKYSDVKILDKIQLIEKLVENRIIENPTIKKTLLELKNELFSNIEKDFEPSQEKHLLEFAEFVSDEDFFYIISLIGRNPNISSQIDNQQYQGADYDVKVDGDNIKLTNKTTDEIIDIDLKKILETLPMKDQYIVKDIIINLPAEVLVDIYHEAKFIKDDRFFIFDRTAAGRYNPIGDDIAFKRKYEGAITLVHELGHAMDSLSKKNYFSFEKNNEYKETFEKEFDEYIAKGGKTYKEANDMSFYCTQNILEMFAECYTLLMLGDCNSKDCILKYFPKTLENVKQHIEYIRSLPQEVRHKK